MCGFDGVRRGNYFGGELIRITEVEVGVEKLKNGKAVCKDEVKGEMINGGGGRLSDWNWRLFNMAFKSSVVPDDWRSAVTVPMYKSKGERT